MRKHLYIPDTQIRKGVPLDHLAWAGQFAVDHKPDEIILAGDWYDMPSVSSYNSNLELEGQRLKEDLEAGSRGLALFMGPIAAEVERIRKNKKKHWNVRVHVTLGNHEERLLRFVNNNPVLHGLIGYDLFDFERWGIHVHDFLKPVEIDGIFYCHYFSNPKNGRPIGGMIETRLKTIGTSFTQGHMQGFQYGELERPTGKVDHGMIAGSFYAHREGYRGHQGNGHWQGIVMKHEVLDGQYDLMKVSLGYLKRKYGKKIKA